MNPRESTAEQPEDAVLVLSALGGDPRAFSVLASRHRGRTGAIVLALLGNPVEAEDVVQDALLRAYRELDRLRDPSRFGAWLRGIAVNLARMRIRSRRRVQLVELVASEGTYGRGRGAEEEFDALERARAVERALSRLSAPQRDTLLAHELDGLSCVEIAAREGKTAGAIRARLHRARERLRDELRAFAPITKEVRPMIEMELYDVMIRLPADTDQSRSALTAPQAVILREHAGDRALPIFVGSVEAGSLALQRCGAPPPRPMTIDLISHLLDVLDAQVERVAVTSLRRGTFYAFVRVAGAEVDARPSDAINIAIRAGAPIVADDEVLAQAAIPGDNLPEGLEKSLRSYQADHESGEWQSLSPQLVLDAWRPWRP